MTKRVEGREGILWLMHRLPNFLSHGRKQNTHYARREDTVDGSIE